jgi:ATP-dependent DNA ligase
MARSILTELPRFIPPMLAKRGAPFDSQEHLFELKWDGTRALAFVDNHGYRLVNRHRADVTDRYPELGFRNNLPMGMVLDGEVVVLRQGKPDFRLLLSRNQARASLKIQSLARTFPATYIVFDLLYDRFESLTALPLRARRQRLEAVVRACANPRLVFSEGIVGEGRAFFEAVCQEGLEGVVAKRLDSRYRPGRRDWIKIKPRSGSLDGMTCSQGTIRGKAVTFQSIWMIFVGDYPVPFLSTMASLATMRFAG